MTQHRLSIEEQLRLSRCRFAAFVAAPTALALIAYSIMTASQEFELQAIRNLEPNVFLGNWALAPPVAAGLLFTLHPVPTGRWWKSIIAALAAVPTYYLSFAFIAITGHALGLRL